MNAGTDTSKHVSGSTRAQFRTIVTKNYTEYRYNSRTQKANGIGDSIRYTLDAVFVGILAYGCYAWQVERWKKIAFVCILLVYVHWRCTEIVHESVFVFPPHGIQLETHRGLRSLPLFASRRFIPAVYIRDIVINEGLRRWSVRYYLAVITETPDGNYELAVAFENTLPRFPVLIDVYRGLRASLFDSDNI